MSATLLCCVQVEHIQPSAAEPPDLSSYEEIRIEISSQLPAAREIQLAEAFVVAGLSETKLFRQVVAGSRDHETEVSLLLQGTIVDLERVSSGTRVFWGIFAGPASVVIEGELIDRRTSRSLGRFVADGLSFGGTFGSTSSEATLHRVAREVVDFIVRGKSGTVLEK
jgi:hypothetical protein